MFAVPKGEDDICPVFDLRWLNQFVAADHFKMEDIRTAIALLEPGDWLTKVDIKDAYMHVLMHADHRPYLGFQRQGRWFRFRTLPFELNVAPRAFTKIMRPVLAFMRANGVRLVAYLDDILVIARSAQESRQHTWLLLYLLSTLGFLVYWTKSVLNPSHAIEFLGFHLDTTAMQLAFPSRRLSHLRYLVSRTLAHPAISLRMLCSVIGTLNSTAMAVLPTRLRTRGLLTQKIRLVRARHAWEQSIRLSHSARRELRWWRRHLQAWNGRSLLHHSPDVAMYTDASPTGWGAVCLGVTAHGAWSRPEQDLHINHLELLAIEMGIRAFRTQLRDRTLLLRVDNTTAVAYINHQGGTHSLALSAVAERIWNLCLRHNIYVEALHIPGIANVLADAASRVHLSPQEWRLHPRLFQGLETRLGIRRFCRCCGTARCAFLRRQRCSAHTTRRWGPSW
jgi:hypothetical protein